jgi:hypothetical protein
MSSHASATHAHPAAARRGRRPKSLKRGRPHKHSSTSVANGERDYAAAGTLTRTKALLLAALRVWELKHRIHD